MFFFLFLDFYLMILDVILDVKNKIKRVFFCLIFKFFYDLVYFIYLIKNKNKGFLNLKKKIKLLMEREGFEFLV